MCSSFEIVVCDLDGTLLSSNKKISTFTAEVIKKVSAKVPVIIATARAPRDVHAYINQFPNTTPCIYYNGALVCEDNGKKVISSHVIESNIITKLFKRLQITDYVQNYVIEKNDQFWVQSIDHYVQQQWIDMGCHPHSIGYPTTFLEDHITKLLIRGDHSKIIPILEEDFEEYLSHIYSDTQQTWLEVMCRDVSKLSAVRLIAKYYGVPLSKVIAFGDAENDREMILGVGMGVAMGNAPPTLKEKAKRIAPTNDEDGVAVVLKELFNI